MNQDDHKERVRQFAQNLRGDDVEWVVNDCAELGVKIGDRFFFMCKGRSLVYNQCKEEVTENGHGPMKWRPVGKREFGETVKPTNEHRKHPKAYDSEGRYVLPLYDHHGPLPDGGWRPMPLQPRDSTHLESNQGIYDVCKKCRRRRWQHRTRENTCEFEA